MSGGGSRQSLAGLRCRVGTWGEDVAQPGGGSLPPVPGARATVGSWKHWAVHQGLCPAQEPVHSPQTCSCVPPQHLHPATRGKSIPALPWSPGPPSPEIIITPRKCRRLSCGNLKFRVKPRPNQTPPHPQPRWEITAAVPHLPAAATRCCHTVGLPARGKVCRAGYTSHGSRRLDLHLLTVTSPAVALIYSILLPLVPRANIQRNKAEENTMGHQTGEGCHRAEGMRWQGWVTAPEHLAPASAPSVSEPAAQVTSGSGKALPAPRTSSTGDFRLKRD